MKKLLLGLSFISCQVIISQSLSSEEQFKVNKKLIDTVWMNDVNRGKTALREGADINIKCKNGFTLLYAAIASDALEVVELLIEHGVDINAQDDRGYTPLDMAAHYRRLEIAKLLIAHGADVNVKNGDGNTPLHKVAAECYVEFATLLIAHGADINAKNNEGLTPLDLVPQGKNFMVVGGQDMIDLLTQHSVEAKSDSWWLW